MVGYRGCFCKKLLEPSSYPISSISKSGLALAKAKPISNSGSMSGKTKLRQKVAMQLQLEREVSICERNNSAHNKVIGEGRGKRCSRH